jgi:hypothetical protein
VDSLRLAEELNRVAGQQKRCFRFSCKSTWVETTKFGACRGHLFDFWSRWVPSRGSQ